jgi:hypothetical protein
MTPSVYNQRQREAGALDSVAWSHLLTLGVEEFQRREGLVVDGRAGPKTQAALTDSLRRGPSSAIPQTRSELRALYADYKYSIKWSKTADGGRRYRGISIHGSWVRDNIVRVRLHNGVAVRLHRDIAAEFRRLFLEASEVSGYTPAIAQGFVARHVLWRPYAPNGKERKLSLHASGLAVDFDPKSNAMFSPDARLWTEDGQKFVSVFESAGWTWGGRFRYSKERNKVKRYGDAMHFQRAGRRC